MKPKKISSLKPLIYLITQGNTASHNFTTESEKIIEIVKLAVNFKIPLVQLREKNLSARFLLDLAKTICDIAKNSETRILINDRADVALAADADGVHLTEKSLPAEIVRQNFPSDFIIGVSAHSLEKIESAKNQGADFATFSPVFPTTNKGEAQGIKKLKNVCERVKPFPVVALGGINAANYLEVLESGASGFAAIRFLNNRGNLRKLSREFL